jgi:hypothetical protein
VHLALGFIDMRKGIDGLAMLVHNVLTTIRLQGTLFVSWAGPGPGGGGGGLWLEPLHQRLAEQAEMSRPLASRRYGRRCV